MSREIQQMSVDEFAASRVALGERVKRFGDVCWVRTRCVFHFPLLPYDACSPSELPPVGLGGFQHVVSDRRMANSVMSFLILDEVQGYSLAKLNQKRRWLIREASKHFTIERITDVNAFKEQGFLAYASFYRRTGYSYKSERKRKADYARWAESVLRFPKALVFGGFDQSGALRAVSISYWVEQTLYYATFFCDTPALQKGVGESMLHVLREAVSRTPGIREVLVRKYQGGNGMDQYYLLRGAKLVHRPANLRLHPATSSMLKLLFPLRYSLLVGGSVPAPSQEPEPAGSKSFPPAPLPTAAVQPQAPAKPSLTLDHDSGHQ